MRISIIGGGPAGNYSAYLLAKAGHNVSVYEEHLNIGEPWACTGVITGNVISRLLELPEDIIVNRIQKARIISPDKTFVDVHLKNEIIVDRAKLDQFLAENAKQAGAKYFVNHRFIGFEKNNGSVIAKIKNKNLDVVKEVESDFLIGADGPRSEVAKAAGIFGKRNYYVGMQVTLNFKNDNAIRFYPSSKGIAWIVPENSKKVRAGIAAKANANSYFDEFMTNEVGKDYKERLIGRQAGAIPLYDPKLTTSVGNVLLVGDAAGMVKAPTLGGINQSLIAATAVAESIGSDRNYKKTWKAKLGRDLWISLMIRKVMNNFSDKDYDNLVRIFGKPKNKKVLEKFDRDEPRKFALKLLLNEPKLLFLCRKLFM